MATSEITVIIETKKNWKYYPLYWLTCVACLFRSEWLAVRAADITVRYGMSVGLKRD